VRTRQRELANILAALKLQYYPDFDATGSVVTGLQEAETGELGSRCCC
jgi:hypothetical protein